MAPVPIPYRCWDGPIMTGPTAGYQHHRNHGEQPCAACRRAAAQYAQDRRMAPKRRQVLLEALAGFDQYRTGRWARTEAATRAHKANRAARQAAYAELRAQGKTRQQAAWRVGITQRTSYRYEATLRAAA